MVFTKISIYIEMPQESWTITRRVIGEIRVSKPHINNEVSTAPKGCMYQSKNWDTWKLSMHCSKDSVAIIMKNLIGYSVIGMFIIKYYQLLREEEKCWHFPNFPEEGTSDQSLDQITVSILFCFRSSNKESINIFPSNLFYIVPHKYSIK